MNPEQTEKIKHYTTKYPFISLLVLAIYIAVLSMLIGGLLILVGLFFPPLFLIAIPLIMWPAMLITENPEITLSITGLFIFFQALMTFNLNKPGANP